MIYKKILAAFFAALFLTSSNAYCASTSWKENESKGAKSQLIASFYKDENGHDKLIVGVHFKINNGWKIYGADSSGVGLPPHLELSGFKNKATWEIIWPKAIQKEEKIDKESLRYSIYQDEVVLPVEIKNIENSKTINLTAKLEYGLCKDICIPVSETFDLKIDKEKDEAALELIQNFYPKKIVKSVVVTESGAVEPLKDKNLAKTTLISALLLAFFGGAILNIMPCVLPILSIKLLSIIKHSGSTISKIRFSFFATICGITSCFLVLALIATLIKITGNSLGWGLQFQNPYFLIFLIIILTFFIANLLGFFEVSFEGFLANFLNKKIDEQGEKKVFIPNFLSGVLAVLLATPCSAPFLGSAISFALTQQSSFITLIFFTIGLGFALPYIVLMIAPKLVHLLPKTGEWMYKVKEILALLLVATVLWLLFVLSHNVGVFQAIAIAIVALLLLIALEIKFKFLRFIAFVALFAAAFAIPTTEKTQNIEKQSHLWKKFDEAELYKLVAQNRVVVVDITADWCLTCKLNKLRVLNDEEVLAKLRSTNIVAMRGDITKPDETIMDFLRKNGRFAIPFNAVYGQGAKNGLLTSELLSKKELLDYIDQASKK